MTLNRTLFVAHIYSVLNYFRCTTNQENSYNREWHIYIYQGHPPFFRRFFLYCSGGELLLLSSEERSNNPLNVRIFVQIALFPRAEEYLNIIMKICVVLSNVQLKSQRPLDSSSSSFECDE